MPSPFPCSPVIRECSWKKTQIEKKKHLLLDGCFCCRNLHSRKSTTRKSTFGSSPPELIWRMMLSKSRQNSRKMLDKEPTLLQSYTKNKPSPRHPPRISPRSWVIIYDYFKNLRATLIPEYFLMAASIYYAFFLLSCYHYELWPNITQWNCLLWFKLAIKVKWFYS